MILQEVPGAEDDGLRTVRQGVVGTISAGNFEALLGKYISKGREIPEPVREHLGSCIGVLPKQVGKLLRPKVKKDGLDGQVDDLRAGRVLAGVRPFKAAVETAELEAQVPEEILHSQCTLELGITIREAKGRLYLNYVGVCEAFDAIVTDRRIATVRPSLQKVTFIANSVNFTIETRNAGADLMFSLGLDTGQIAEPQVLSEGELAGLYDGAMEEIALQKKTEDAKKPKEVETIPKKVGTLKELTIKSCWTTRPRCLCRSI